MRLALFALFLVAGLACAQDDAPLVPGVTYDPAIPTERQVLGYDPGERITTPADIVSYLRALAEAAPARMKVFEYARSWLDRPG